MNELIRAILRIYLSDPSFYVQLLLFVALASSTLLLARWLRRVDHALPGWRWQGVLGHFYLPLFGLLGGRFISQLLLRAEWESAIFNRLYALFWVLLFYRGAVAFVHRVSPTNAPLIQRRILIPLALLFVVLRLAGQLGILLTLLNNAKLFTIGAGDTAFTVTLSLLIFGPLTLILIYVVTQGLRTLLVEDFLPNAGLGPSRAYATGTLLSYLLLIIGLLAAMAALGIDLTTLTVVSSALAVGIGFGLQDTINNMMSGFLIMLDPILNVGDMIEVTEERGMIRRIGVRNTVIEALDGTQIVIPNATLASSPVLNLSQSSRPVKVTLMIPVGINANARRIEETILEILGAHAAIRATPAPLIALDSFSQGAMTFKIVFWAESIPQATPVTNDVNLAIWEQMQTLGYDLAPVTVSPAETKGG